MADKDGNLPKIRVFIEDHTGNKIREARIAADVPVFELLPALLVALELPVTDPGGRPITWHLAYDDSNIAADVTLRQAGVTDGAQLTVVPEMTAGGPGLDDLPDLVAKLIALLRPRTATAGEHTGLLEQLIERVFKLEKQVQDLEGRSAYPIGNHPSTIHPSAPEPSTISLTVAYDSRNQRSFRISGAIELQSFDDFTARWDGDSWSQWARRMAEHWASLVVKDDIDESRRLWSELRQRGQILHGDVFGGDATLQLHFAQARATVAPGHEDHLLLRFAGPRWHLGIPFELLLEPGSGVLATRYAMCRSVLGAQSRGGAGVDTDLAAVRDSLRVLLVASPSRHGASLEIQELRRVFGNAVAVTTVSASNASWDEVVKQLDRCRYHVVHIAAMGLFNAIAPDESALLFPRESGALDMKPLSARRIGELLRGSATRLFFASADYSAATAGREFLSHCDYLGVMDALVLAGVPCIIGYRWAVDNDGARDVATRFYERLLATGSPTQALRHARCEGSIERSRDATHTGLVMVAS